MNVLSIPGNIVRGTSGLVVQSAEAVIDFAVPGFKVKDSHSTQDGQLNVYQMADPMLDMSTAIYLMSELRRCARGEIEKLQKDLNLDDDQMDVIMNAIKAKDAILKDMEEAAEETDDEEEEEGGGGRRLLGRLRDLSSHDSMVVHYQKSLQELKTLAARYNMSTSHMESFEKFNEIVRVPKTSGEFLSDLRVYGSLITPGFTLAFGGEDFNRDSLASLVERTLGKTQAEVVEFDDEFDELARFGSELCYAIAVSENSKTITVIFRGSVRPQDFVTDLNLNTSELRMPGFTDDKTGFANGSEDTRPFFGMVHNGFNEYLFGATKRGENERTISKSEVIISKVKSLLEGRCQGYDVYFTGHSLGASLSTLMAFRAVAMGDIPHVKNVSFASPLVGDQEFRNNFEKLEMEGKILHLRVSNNEDLVPLIPFATYDMKPYKHVGMNVRMYDPSLLTPFYRVFYPKNGDVLNEVRTAAHSNLLLGFTLSFISNHLCPEYRKRLDNSKEELEKISVEQLYKDNDITGWKDTE